MDVLLIEEVRSAQAKRSLHKDGDTYWIYFFYTWCLPCNNDEDWANRYTPSDNPYIHLKNYQVTYHDAKQGYTEVFQVRRVGIMYFCVGGVTGP